MKRKEKSLNLKIKCENDVFMCKCKKTVFSKHLLYRKKMIISSFDMIIIFFTLFFFFRTHKYTDTHNFNEKLDFSLINYAKQKQM